MTDYALGKRCTDILKILLNANGHVKISSLTDQLGMSRRSIYYDLDSINDWLKDHHLDELQRDRNKGIAVSPGQVAKIREILFRSDNRVFRAFSPVEREQLILCIILLQEGPAYTEDFMKYCDVSRNTVVSDLKNAAAFLKKNKLKLNYRIKRGYWIEGDPVRKRAAFFLYYPQFIDYFTGTIYSENQLAVVSKNQLLLKEIEHELHTEYVSGILPTLAAFISSIENEGPNRRDVLKYSDVDIDEITGTQEYQLVCRYFHQLDENERIYIALHLLGSRTQTEPILLKDGSKKASEIASQLVNSFEEISGIRYDDQTEILGALTSHLKTSLYRYRYGIQLGNPMLDSIKTEYKELFNLTKAAFLRISDDIGFKVSDAEIAYLTLHFGAFMTPSGIENRSYKILVVCPNGIGTSSMIKAELRRIVPQATEIKNIPLSKYSADNDFDVIVSTVPIAGEANLILVNPIMTDQDRVAVLRKCINMEPTARMQVDAVIQIARKYILPDQMPAFEEEITNLLASQVQREVPKEYFGMGLMRYLKPSHIQVISEETDWIQAIELSCRPLLLDDSVTQEYVDAIVKEQVENHHHMFLVDGLVLAHSRSENGVKKVDAAITVFKKPVTWDGGKTVRVIIGLAAEDEVRHIQILNDILDVFFSRKSVEQMTALRSSYEVSEYIRSRLEASQE